LGLIRARRWDYDLLSSWVLNLFGAVSDKGDCCAIRILYLNLSGISLRELNNLVIIQGDDSAVGVIIRYCAVLVLILLLEIGFSFDRLILFRAVKVLPFLRNRNSFVGASGICLISRDNLRGDILVIVFNSEDVDTGRSVGTLRVKGWQSALCAKREKADIAWIESEVLIQFVSWGAKNNLALISTSLLYKGAHTK
jgi:hypothetical protein